MKLIVIGRNDQESDIVLASDYVSNYHAEIIQLDNGDMFIVDKSTNGTFVNGKRLTPGKETPIHRGDNVTFADVPLDWSMIHDVTVPRDVKQIKSIGSHYMNDISVQGPNVSRFHATLREMNNGKWYICDHSRNGTTVNGRRLRKNEYVLLNKGDEISCAGVPVQNPIKSSGKGLKIALIVLAAACLCVGAFFGWKYLFPSDEPMPDTEVVAKYENSVVLVACEYHFEVEEHGTADLSAYGIDTKFVLHSSDGSSYDKIVTYDGTNGMTGVATGFFIGNDGYIATNLHVVKPWIALGKVPFEKKNGEKKYITYMEIAEQLYRDIVEFYANFDTSAIQLMHQIKVVGVLDNIMIIPNGSYFDPKNAYNCHEVICGATEDEDLAIIKLKTNSLPEGVTPVPLDKIHKTEPTKGSHVITIGFPFGLELQELEDKQLQANNASGDISRNNIRYSFSFTAVSYHGASGSPVFNNKGELVGVLNQGVSITQGFNDAIRAEFLEKLIKEADINR